MSNLLYNSRISKVKFHLAGSEDALKESFVQVTSYDLFRNNTPYPSGPCDAHMGTMDHEYKCQSCFNNKKACLGHPGHIRLNYPVWNPMAITEARKWLKLICFDCGHPIIDKKTYMRFPRSKRLAEASKLARNSTKPCVNCGSIHPTLTKMPKEPLVIVQEFKEGTHITDKKVLMPHKAHAILSRISDLTLIRMGKSIRSHPRNMLLNVIQVPPVTIRPDVQKMGGGKSTNDNLTSMIQFIVKKNEMIPTVIPDTIDVKLEKSIMELNNAYYDFVRAGGEGNVVSLALRLKGKGGRFRKTQMGKRTRNMCRSTIAGSPRIKIDEVGVPLVFARTIQYADTVQDYNKHILLQYIQNGRKKYPGATKVVKKNGASYDVESEREIELENGDTVWRDMIDGDPVNFNRQPSLLISNISCHKARVYRDPSIKTIMMNVIACAFYNADFDGDAMNLVINSSLASRNEISELSNVSNWLVSHTNGIPTIGQTDDSIIGSAELTRSNVVYNKYNAMLLFQNTTTLPSFDDVQPGVGISGRDCITKLIKGTPVNFSRMSLWYKPSNAPYYKYDPTEIKVVVDQGQLKSGILDKASIGKGARGGLYHILCNEYGTEKTLDIIYNMQQLAISHLGISGFTIGILDLIMPDDSKRDIEMIAADIINKSLLITEELNDGEIIPPIGKTIEQFFEERQINTLSIFDDFTEPILRGINPDVNNLFKLIATGSKGKMDNMFNMISAVGQKLINGERIRQKFGFKRTLSYFPRFDNSPEARGYITNSYLGGMTLCEYIFNAMASRFDLISKALSTSVTGEQNRKSIKNLESIIINNFRWAVKNFNVIQFVYGEDSLDPRKLERVSFPTVMISDASFTEKYAHPDFPEFFQKMKEDRDEYRRVFFKVEQSNVKELLSADRTVAVDVARVITDVTKFNESALAEPSAKTLKEMTSTVEALCSGIPYVLINEIQEKARMPIPEFLKQACWLLVMLIRSHLCPNELIRLKMTPKVLGFIIDKIRLKLAQALIEPGTAVGIIAAQSFSEPLTQYMLDAHHRSASGGTSNTGMTQAREILGAKDVSKLSSPKMVVPVLPEYASEQLKVQEIANNIEVMKLNQFVIVARIFFEKFGEPVHPQFAHETEIFRAFTRANRLLIPPGDLTRWCIHLTLNKTSLILKNMSMETIVNALRESFPQIYLVYTPENSETLVIRVYMRAGIFKGIIQLQNVQYFLDDLLTTVIRGVNGIINTNVVQLVRNKIDETGAIVRDNNCWGIITSGTNMRDILTNKYVDKSRVLTDAIQEVRAVLGVEAARTRIASALRDFEVCNFRHYLIYADEMTYTGNVTSIESSGLKTRESSNVLLRMGFSSPIATMEEAAFTGMEDSVTGVTAPLLVGSIPRHGTFYNSFHVDVDFVKNNVKKADDLINELFEI